MPLHYQNLMRKRDRFTSEDVNQRASAFAVSVHSSEVVETGGKPEIDGLGSGLSKVYNLPKGCKDFDCQRLGNEFNHV